jgi:hypothetical protein
MCLCVIEALVGEAVLCNGWSWSRRCEWEANRPRQGDGAASVAREDAGGIDRDVCVHGLYEEA